MTNSLADIVVKATPGPWVIDPRHYWDKEIVIEQVTDGWKRFRCEVDYDDCDPETADANAQLIALAPTLATLVLEAREALREAREALHQHYVDWDGEPEDAAPLQIAREKCSATLAKLESL